MEVVYIDDKINPVVEIFTAYLKSFHSLAFRYKIEVGKLFPRQKRGGGVFPYVLGFLPITK